MKPIVAILIVAALAACGTKTENQPKSAAAPQKAPAQQSALEQMLPPDHPPIPRAGDPVTAPPASQANAAKLTGKVLESIDAGGYTYLKLRTASGDVWTAVQQTAARPGTEITILPQITMENFESKTLNRKFDQVIFGVVDGGQRAPMGMPPGMASAAAVNVKVAKVAKAEGADAKTVAEVWAARGVLKDKPVSVKGTVVKFLPSIMGKNWLHLRDGSGTRAKGDDDLTVTTADTVAVGDVVLVRGTVRTEKDFGAGYNYAVIVEEAKVSK